MLDRLDKVRGRDGRWTARCPSHDDRGPSLSIGEGDSDAVLIHCHAGCAPDAVVGAVGLSLADLFPREARDHELPARRYERRPRVDYKALVFLLRHESYVLAIAAEKVRQGEALNDDERDSLGRVMKNFERLRHVP